MAYSRWTNSVWFTRGDPSIGASAENQEELNV